MEQLPPMEMLVRRLEAITIGESKETREKLILEKGEWMVREAEDWVRLTKEAQE